MPQSEFKKFHPVVNFTYFVFVITFSCVFMNPVCLAVSLICGTVYCLFLKGAQALKTSLKYVVSVAVLAVIINPLFNHQGVTVICYFPSGNPLTMESVFYGLGAAAMIAAVICWFSCYNEIMTSDKFIYLFGKVIPSLSLILSMTLRFVPKFAAQLKVVVSAQRGIGRGAQKTSVIKRAKYGLNILSIMTTWALENAIDTADSMKSKGYGIMKRTSFSIYTFDKRDIKALLVILILGIYTLVGSLMGVISFSYFPTISGIDISFFGVSVIASYMLLCAYPAIVEIREVIRWKALKSKM